MFRFKYFSNGHLGCACAAPVLPMPRRQQRLAMILTLLCSKIIQTFKSLSTHFKPPWFYWWWATPSPVFQIIQLFDVPIIQTFESLTILFPMMHLNNTYIHTCTFQVYMIPGIPTLENEACVSALCASDGRCCGLSPPSFSILICIVNSEERSSDQLLSAVRMPYPYYILYIIYVCKYPHTFRIRIQSPYYCPRCFWTMNMVQ